MAGKVEKAEQDSAREVLLTVLNMLFEADMPEGKDEEKVEAALAYNGWKVKASRAAEGGFHIHLWYGHARVGPQV